MAVAGIPEVIHDFNLYESGSRLLGMTGEVALPNFEALTETISGAGILGEIDASVIGRFGSMTQDIPFRAINTDYLKLLNPMKPAELTLRGAIQQLNAGTGAVEFVGMRVVLRGTCKTVTPGTVKQGGPMDSSVSLELTYILIELNGKSAIELNKLGGVYRVNGVDLLAPVRKLT